MRTQKMYLPLLGVAATVGLVALTVAPREGHTSNPVVVTAAAIIATIDGASTAAIKSCQGNPALGYQIPPEAAAGITVNADGAVSGLNCDQTEIKKKDELPKCGSSGQFKMKIMNVMTNVNFTVTVTTTKNVTVEHNHQTECSKDGKCGEKYPDWYVALGVTVKATAVVDAEPFPVSVDVGVKGYRTDFTYARMKDHGGELTCKKKVCECPPPKGDDKGDDKGEDGTIEEGEETRDPEIDNVFRAATPCVCPSPSPSPGGDPPITR